MKLIYVGSSRPESIAQEYMRQGSAINFAGMTLQNALLDGLYSHDKNISIISAWFISAYPKVKQVIFPPQDVKFKDNKRQYRFVGAINLPIINMLAKFLKTRKELKKQLNETKDNAVIVYETYIPFVLAAATLRNRINKAVVIVPDLPEFMHGSRNPIKVLLKKINHRLLNWCLKRFDGYVLLSDPMRERLPAKDKYIVMEGIFNPEFQEKNIDKETNPTIMYTGGVYRHRGTDLLLDAFSKIENPNYRLWIRGDGELKSKILEMAAKDPRIKYFPPMKREELLELEQRATVMVNTTPPLDFTRFFFPSKNMEYLASGTPTVMFRLGCMPPEYNSYIYYVDGNDADSLSQKLVEVCEKPRTELASFGAKAKEFILTKKNPHVQCGRIINFIQSL